MGANYRLYLQSRRMVERKKQSGEMPAKTLPADSPATTSQGMAWGSHVRITDR